MGFQSRCGKVERNRCAAHQHFTVRGSQLDLWISEPRGSWGHYCAAKRTRKGLHRIITLRIAQVRPLSVSVPTLSRVRGESASVGIFLHALTGQMSNVAIIRSSAPLRPIAY